MITDDNVLGCPVCRTRFRGAVTCPRCGADLGAVMALVAQAHRQRSAARTALLAGDPDRALSLAAKAQALCDTCAGRRLVLLARALTQGFQTLALGNPTASRFLG